MMRWPKSSETVSMLRIWRFGPAFKFRVGKVHIEGGGWSGEIRARIDIGGYCCSSLVRLVSRNLKIVGENKKGQAGAWPRKFKEEHAWLANAPLKFGTRDPKYKPSPRVSKVLFPAGVTILNAITADQLQCPPYCAAGAVHLISH